ncbi:MAG: ABC-2 family transporter protein [Ktedonobacteraceae bacterium]|nr:ABC-2 family transporter protein [Ktedonobacteraceae bacterium]MBO0789433.1 ABC-2 family transporter protein [Ktedonobacteraceae bacterium]
MYYLRLIATFIRISIQEETAYSLNFFIGLLSALLNLGTGLLGLLVLFSQVNSVRGWTFSSTLALLGVYILLGALRGLFIGPSLNALVGLDGEVWTGRFDFTLLRPLNAQVMASLRHWRLFSLFDLLTGVGVLSLAIIRLQQALEVLHLLKFLIALGAAITILYAILLFFSALLFWSPGFLFTWIFDGLFQMARYPVGLYPGWLGLVLTWIIPVGLMTTIPAQALNGTLSSGLLVSSAVLAVLLFVGATAFFQVGLRHYTSASS